MRVLTWDLGLVERQDSNRSSVERKSISRRESDASRRVFSLKLASGRTCVSGTSR